MLYQSLIIFIGIVVGFVVATVIYGGFKYKDVRDSEGEKISFFRRGIVGRQIQKKKQNLDKVLELLEEKGEMSNSDIHKILGVSKRTVVNYMDILEKENKVEQVGNTGRSVLYQLKK